jgi:hypothetical protein
MKPNKNILRAAGRLRAVWIFLLCLMLVMAVASWWAVNTYAAGFGWDNATAQRVGLCFLAVIGLAALILTVFFLRRIGRTKALAQIEPLNCRVEDILLHSFVRDNKRQYRPYLLVCDLQTGKRYFSYGKHCLSFYTFTVSKANHTLVDVIIARDDGSQVNIGDDVKLYIRRELTVKVSSDAAGELRLNGTKYPLQNAAGDCTPKIFDRVIFAEAAVDVE